MEINITSFMTWFLSQIYSIFSQIFSLLDRIILAPGVSMLDFSITLFILGFVVTILIASPGNAMRVEKVAEGKAKSEQIRKERDSRAKLRRR